MDKMITATSAPALGDVVLMEAGDTLWIAPEARQRKDWARYAWAAGCAVGRGAEIRSMGDAR